MEQTTARLRKTFQYKTDDIDSDDSLPEALDEEGPSPPLPFTPSATLPPFPPPTRKPTNTLQNKY